MIVLALVAATSAVAQPDSAYLNAMMGIHPDAMHNTTLRQHVLYGGEAWSSDLTDAEQLQEMYGLVGAKMDGWHTWAKHSDQGLMLGGDRPHQSAQGIWAFRAPLGTAFQGGRIRVTLALSDTWSDAATSPTISLVEHLTLKGGGKYFQPFTGVASGELVSDPADRSTPSEQTLTLDIPQGLETFSLVITRPVNAPKGARVNVQKIEVDAQVQRDQVLRLSLSQSEPFWNVGDDVNVELRSVGRQPITTVGYNVLRFNGEAYKPLAQQMSELVDGSTAIDLAPFGAGYYQLEAYAADAPQQILDRLEVVVLRSQNPGLTHETSLFGAMQPDRDPELAQSIGIKWSGNSFLWAWSQAGPNAPIKLDDAWVDISRSHGMEPKALIFTAPRWANGGGNGPTPPTERHYDDWVKFNREVAKAMGDRVTWYEAWNEPNNGHQLVFKGPQPERAALAKKLQRLQYKGLLQGNPQAKLIGGNFAGLYPKWVEYWLKSESVADAQHALSGHPYCKTTPDVHWAHKYPPEPDLVPRLLEFRQIMNQYGAADQPTFWTEFGWDTAEVSEAEQARWTARQFVMIQAYQETLKTKAAFVFTFNPRFDYSIVRYASAVAPGQHRLRPVAGAIATTSSLLAGSELVARHRDHPDTTRLYEFRNQGRRIFAAWTTEQASTQQLTLPISTPTSATQINLLGDEQQTRLAPDQAVSLPDNHDPVFFVLPAE